MNKTRLRYLTLVLLAAVGISACGSDKKSSTTPADQPGKGKPAVTMGDKNFTEEYILGELYAQALRAKGFSVNLKPNIGSSELIDKALTSGKIDLYPEYTGTLVSVIAKITDDPKSAEQAHRLATQFEAKRGFTTLDITPFFNADAIAVLPAYAQKHGLKTISDLKKLKSFSFGAPPENRTRVFGVVGLHKVYGLTNLKFVPLAIGIQYRALDTGKIDTATVFTTDGALKGGKYVVLKDDKVLFGYQNVTPVVSKKVLDQQGPAFASTLNAVSAKLTNEAMQTMNAAVDLDKQQPAAVAKKFLEANGLL